MWKLIYDSKGMRNSDSNNNSNKLRRYFVNEFF